MCKGCFLDTIVSLKHTHTVLKVHILSEGLSSIFLSHTRYIRGVNPSCSCKISVALAGVPSGDPLSCSDAVHQPDKRLEPLSAPIQIESQHRWPITALLLVVNFIAKQSTSRAQVRLIFPTALQFSNPFPRCISCTS